MLRDEPLGEVDQRRAAGVFERHLVRVSVQGLAEERARCADCGRTPLIGEDVHTYDRGEVVCELCRQLRPAQPVASERVRHSEYGHAVRVRRLG